MQTWTLDWAFRNLISELLMPPGIWIISLLLAFLLFRKKPRVSRFNAAAPPLFLACFNPHSYVVSNDDVKFSSALKSATYLIPDGIGVVLASKILGGSILKRATGFDLFYRLMQMMDLSSGGKVFFLGSTEECLQKITSRCRDEFSNIDVVGTYSPPFSDFFSISENQKIISMINRSNADVLWVGMTAPKQEKWILEHVELLNVRFIGAIGAVFDFYGDRINRDESFLVQYGFEWLFRLLKSPRRLWRRTLISAPIFIYNVFLFRFKNIHKLI